MTVTVMGAVIVDGTRIPVETRVELPDEVALSLMTPARLRAVPKAG